ncbi:PoNe immunity protein domain-containing protein [uncultured Zobellia sp.]|uniref:PoNe immunity protein domain-containing protein n=1 Tax=uncultured Zobellia sp. TaxID=255433 RepID=UPI002599BA41|nr:PoNe immunity protein domain-containing protein [uncultured Zobellia sp.]
MNLRDTLNTKEGYQELIDDSIETIKEDKERIISLTKDIENGIQNYPRPNKEIIKAIKDDFADKYFDVFLTKYSIGEPVKEIIELVEIFNLQLVDSWEIESGYVQMVNALSIGILVEIENSKFDKLVRLVERDNVNDYLIDFLIRHRKPDWPQSDKFLWNKPYKGISEIVTLSQEDKAKALERLKKYLSEWYRNLEIKTHESKWNIHTGYWCWEAGAIVKILGLDDSSLKDQQYYPYDMVHWKD